ncbi:CRISPR-associated endonuclease Cas2 [Alloscardovia theropitheci]|nr:CRISPR-associated endonuclease Cas2 [Alloscardovia theropitheci]
MIFFDLPTLTDSDRKNYRLFRKSLVEEGFLMIQESVYVRIATTHESAEFIENRIKSIVPPKGVVQSLIVTEKQYASIRFLVGESIDDFRNLDVGTVVI